MGHTPLYAGKINTFLASAGRHLTYAANQDNIFNSMRFYRKLSILE